MAEGLTEGQRELVMSAASAQLGRLLTDHPEVAKVPVGIISNVFLAGVAAGVDALDAVLKDGLVRYQAGE
jgi:hypothetical protein